MSHPTSAASEGSLRATDEEIARTFRDYDTNDDKSLSVSEIKQALAKLKLRVADSDLQALVCKIDTDKSNTVSFDEFKTFYREREATLYTAFVNLNSSHQQSSVLSAASLRGGLSAMNLKASDDEIRRFIQRLDRNQDGHVSFDEFRDCLLLLPPTNARAVFDTFRDSMYFQHSIGEYSPPLDLVQAHASTQLQGALGMLLSPVSAQLIGGAVAGAASRTGTAPLSLLVARSQVAPNNSGIVSAMKDIYQKEGTRSLFRGNGVNCLKIMPETAFKMFIFDISKSAMSSDPNLISGPQRFIAGGFAGAVSQIMVYPLEAIKTRLSVSPSSMYSGVSDCFSKTLKAEGPRALYRGCVTSVVGIIPYAGIDLMMSSMLRDACVKYYDSRCREPGPFAMLGVGVFSGSMAMTLTYPIGLARTRLQASGLPGTQKYDSAMHVLVSTWQKDGLKGLFRGWVPTLFKVAPAAGISFGAYSAINDRFASLRRQHNRTNAPLADLKK